MVCPSAPTPLSHILVEGAEEHNLKRISVAIPKRRLVVVTGVSGSGKSSLAFDTLYAEGHRRYIVSLSHFARQFMEQMEKPAFESIRGLSPAISIEQRTAGANPRSSVGTVTEILDYLRVLYARLGEPRCPSCGQAVGAQTPKEIATRVMALPSGTRFHVMAPAVRARKGIYRKELGGFLDRGFVRARIDGTFTELHEGMQLQRSMNHDIDVIVDSLVRKDGMEKRLLSSLELALGLPTPSGETCDAVIVHLLDEKRDMLFSRRMGCPNCGINLLEMSPRLFSFNSPKGWCEQCQGLGVHYEPDPSRILPDRSLSLNESGYRFTPAEAKNLTRILAKWEAGLDTPMEELPAAAMKIVMDGSGEPGRTGFRGLKAMVKGWFENERWSEESRHRWIGPYMRSVPCEACGGERLNAQARSVFLSGQSLPQFLALSVDRAAERVAGLCFAGRQAPVAEPLLKEIRERLWFLQNVGLGYLTLDRPSATLSGGEAQRVRLATQVGCRLRGVLYVLDEPTIGLHRRDNLRLLDTLKQLRDLGNTVVVVEHDEDTIRAADYLIDLGPGAGVHGGHLAAHGTPDEVARTPSPTGDYLSGLRRIALPQKRRLPERGKNIEIFGACANNLKNVNVKFPAGLITVVTGVSGSGKSSLVFDTLYPAASNFLNATLLPVGAHRKISGLKLFQRIVAVDQSPLGRTPRSNPATYTGALGPIRDLFASLPAAKMRGFTKSRFSFNVKGGRCETCRGMGTRKVAMAFMPDQLVECEGCGGSGFNRETMQVHFKEKSIADVLGMTVEEALAFFHAVPRVHDPLETLAEVGLGYLKLGQPTVSLSGGEAQRMRLAREIRVMPRVSARHRATLYVLDEPTIGLHFQDVARLIEILQRLRDNGHTVIVIEHHPDVIKCADWLVDMGPEGGEGGGRVTVSGPPESVAKCRTSHTAAMLREILSREGTASRGSA